MDQIISFKIHYCNTSYAITTLPQTSHHYWAEATPPKQWLPPVDG